VDAVEKQGGVEIVEEIATNELYGFAVSKENPALLEAMNGALQTLKDDGTIADLYQQYFQTDPPDSVLTGKTQNPG
jgi:ABC-type amino acid transport substrate-binding protein